MHRLLIYLTYDKQNIVDDYIGYFLQCMQSVTDSIVVVCNMKEIKRGLHNLSDYADAILYRDNIGLDAGGFKDALCNLVGWDKVNQYDELILANDSFYGPFDNIKNIFLEMESRKLDFWGLMKRGAGEYGITGKDPEHILSFFYVFQEPLIHSREFRAYWEEMPYYEDYMMVVKRYERQLTKHFHDLGYTYDAYADTAPNETKNLKNQFFQCDYLSYEMMVKRKFPFLKRKQLAYNTLYCQTQENQALSIEYVDKCTNYDVNLIWKNLIRTQNHTQLQRSLGLQYILKGKPKKKDNKAIIFVRAKWMNAVDTVCEYLAKIRNSCDIHIIAGNESIRLSYQNWAMETTVSEKLDIDILQTVDYEKYQYACMIHDTDLSSELIPSCTGKSYFYNVWENLIKDEEHVNAVVDLMNKKPQIGMLMHPVPIFSMWIGEIGFGWKDKYDEVKKCIDELGLNAVVDVATPPINVTDNFWVRTELINSFSRKNCLSLYKNHISSEMYHYLWNYIVQDNEKLTGIVESGQYAAFNETNYQYYMRTFIEWFTERYGFHSSLLEFEEIFHVQSAVEKCKMHHKIWYVYGTGEVAERCFAWIKDAEAFIISDGQEIDRIFHGKPVMYLSELKQGNGYGVILCLSKENQDQVIKNLEKKEIWNYYRIH